MKKHDIEFLKNLQNELLTQTNDGNADPVFWGIMETVESIVPSGCGKKCQVVTDCHDIVDADNYVNYIEDNYKSNFTDTILEEWEDLKNTPFTFLSEYVDFVNEYLNLEHYIVEIDDVDKLSQNTGAFLTKKAAQEYIQKYGYNHNRPRTWAMTAFRNFEYENLLRIIKELDFSKIIEDNE